MTDRVIPAGLLPLVEVVGESIRREVLAPIPLVGLQWEGTAQPFLYTSTTSLNGTSNRIALNAGSIWIPANQLVNGVPTPSFVGLRIGRGIIELPVPVNLNARPVQIPLPSPVQVKLNIEPQDGDADPGSGLFGAILPRNIQFTFRPTGARLVSADNAEVKAFGTTSRLRFQNRPATYSAETSRVEFPFISENRVFTITAGDSSLVKFSGDGPVNSAQWFLPLMRTSDSSLPAAEGAGGLSLKLDGGLLMEAEHPNLVIDSGPCVLSVDRQGLMVTGMTGNAVNVAREVNSGPGTSITFRTPTAIPYGYSNFSDGREVWGIGVPVSAVVSQLRNVNNARARLTGLSNITISRQGNTTITTIQVVSDVPPEKQVPQSYCIKNLLFGASDPLRLTNIVNEVDGSLSTGSVTIDFDLRFVVPILPDPYAANLVSVPDRRRSSIGTLRAVVEWDASEEPTIDLTIKPLASADTGRALGQSVGKNIMASVAEDSPRITTPMLLDLSTSASQFGVALGLLRGTPRSASSTAEETPQTTSISDLTFNITGSNVAVVTLPAVQWEPVYTYDPMVTQDGTPFPSPLVFADSGRIAEFMSNSVELVPFSPEQALDSLVSTYNEDETNVVLANFTLPFGIQASARLAHSQIPLVRSPGLTLLQPKFPLAGMTGCHQLSLTGSRGRVLIGSPPTSPSFPGSAVQLLNALDSSGNPAHQRVTAISSSNADVITEPFNQTFRSGSDTAKVPVTRIDISGFGESTFSDWRFKNDRDATAITKVEFNVLVGRTAREVIQLSSILYPFAVRVVRTITIQRRNTGIVVREDSGWQAVTDGDYLYPTSPSVTQPIITHPGIVHGIRDVKNIRDLNLATPVRVAGGIELVGVRFDCFADIENTISGRSTSGVPSRDLLGYVQKTPGPPLNASQFQELLTKVGPLGGLVDCIVKVGGSGQRIRVSQIGIGASRRGATIEFAVAAWGAPSFPVGGQWSFLLMESGDQAPSAVSPAGVPIIRQGRSGLPTPPTSEYRFSDPRDLLDPTQPSSTYCLCHATGTQRVLFPRPVIRASAPWAFSSDRPPYLADSYALGTSAGPFPRLQACIVFNNANYQLFISTTGHLKLQLEPGSSSTSFTPARTRRILKESDTFRSIAITENEFGDSGRVTIVIDTANPVPWSLEITNLSLISEIPNMAEGASDPRAAEVTRVVGSIRSAANLKTEVSGEPRVVFGPALKPVKDAMAFFEKFGPLAPVEISMTNSWSVWASLSIDLDKLAAKAPAPGLKEFLDKFFDKLNFDLDFVQHSDSGVTWTKHKFLMRLKFPFGAYLITLIGSFEYYAGTDGKNYLLQIGGGFGADFSFGPFMAFAFIEATILGMMGDHTWGVGGSVIISAHIDYKVVSVQASIETRQMFMVTDCTTPSGPSQTKWGLTQILVAIEIHICWVVDIDYHSTSEWKTKFNDGLCDMTINSNTRNAGQPS